MWSILLTLVARFSQSFDLMKLTVRYLFFLFQQQATVSVFERRETKLQENAISGHHNNKNNDGDDGDRRWSTS